MDAHEETPRSPQPSHHLLANLRELMAAWFQQRDNGLETSDVEKQLADAAARQGLSLGFKKMRVAEVPDHAFPVVLLEKAGASRLVLSRIDAETYLCHGQGVRFRATAAELAEAETGTVFLRVQYHRKRSQQRLPLMGQRWMSPRCRRQKRSVFRSVSCAHGQCARSLQGW